MVGSTVVIWATGLGESDGLALALGGPASGVGSASACARYMTTRPATIRASPPASALAIRYPGLRDMAATVVGHRQGQLSARSSVRENDLPIRSPPTLSALTGNSK